MWDRLRRFSALEAPARALFLRASLLLPLVALGLRCYGFRGTRNALQHFLPVGETESIWPRDTDWKNRRAAMTARMVRAAVRYSLTPASCLEESLTLWWLLRRQGINSELRIGVRKGEGKQLQAHAWVERDAVLLGDSLTPHQHYAAFDAEFSASPPVVP